MKRNTVITLIVLAAIALLLIFLGGRRESDRNIISDDDLSTFAPEEIEAFHSFASGTHMIAGTLDLPTPCHTLETRAIVRESFPEQVTIEIETSIDDDIVCAQVITPTDFSVEFEASDGATIGATFNGQTVPLRLSDLNDVTEGSN